MKKKKTPESVRLIRRQESAVLNLSIILFIITKTGLLTINVKHIVVSANLASNTIQSIFVINPELRRMCVRCSHHHTVFWAPMYSLNRHCRDS